MTLNKITFQINPALIVEFIEQKKYKNIKRNPMRNKD